MLLLLLLTLAALVTDAVGNHKGRGRFIGPPRQPWVHHHPHRHSHHRNMMAEPEFTPILGSFRTGDAGPGVDIQPGASAFCPLGHYIKGMKLASEHHAGRGDDTAVNKIRFVCTDGTELMSKGGEGPWGEGNWGRMGPEESCDGNGVGFGASLKVEFNDSASDPNFMGLRGKWDVDQKGVVNVSFCCSNASPKCMTYKDARSYGHWVTNNGLATMCRDHSHNAFCGFRTWFHTLHPEHESHQDDMAVTGLDMYCCPI